MNSEQQANQWGQVVAKAWQDDAFKKRLVANPSVALKEEGFEVPSGVQIRIVENTEKLVYVTLPARPLDGEISDVELEGVAGGGQVKPMGTLIRAILSVLADLDKPKIDLSKLPQDKGPKPL